MHHCFVSSFHVGSGAEEAEAYAAAVEQAHYVFELGREFGFKLDLLDIGGGFPGQKNAAVSFGEVRTCSCFKV